MQPTETKLTITEIAAFVGGMVEGDADRVITRLASLEDGKPGALCFLADPRYVHHIYDTACAAVLVDNRFVPEKPVAATLIRVAKPQFAFNQICTSYFVPNHHREPGIEPQAYVAPSAKIGQNASIGAFCYISEGVVLGDNVTLYPGVYLGKGVTIGDNTTLYPHTCVYYGCQIGANCIVHSGSVIGGDGFGFLREGDRNVKVPQIGIVVVEDDVEIGSNCAIDRATIGVTLIRKGVKIDNLVHLAHNTDIGETSIIAGQAGVAGSSRLGKGCLLGGQVGVSPHVQLADYTQVSAQSGISKSIKNPGKKLRGSPAREMNSQLKFEAQQGRIPELLKRIEQLEKALEKFLDKEDS